jgi:hypothetical protein
MLFILQYFLQFHFSFNLVQLKKEPALGAIILQIQLHRSTANSMQLQLSKFKIYCSFMIKLSVFKMQNSDSWKLQFQNSIATFEVSLSDFLYERTYFNLNKPHWCRFTRISVIWLCNLRYIMLCKLNRPQRTR